MTTSLPSGGKASGGDGATQMPKITDIPLAGGVTTFWTGKNVSAFYSNNVCLIRHSFDMV